MLLSNNQVKLNISFSNNLKRHAFNIKLQYGENTCRDM